MSRGPLVEPTTVNAPGRPRPRAFALAAAATLAVAAPTFLAYNVPPSSTFLNQALALAGWGWFLLAAAWIGPAPAPGTAAKGWAAWPLALALGLLGLAAAASWGLGSWPSPLALSSLGLLAAAALVLRAGVHAAATGSTLFVAFCIGWLVAGLGGVGLSLVQVFRPEWADGDWIARSSVVGRAVGNLRQPNHLASVLLWAVLALVALHELRRLPFRVAGPLMALLVWAVVLTASRTGALSVALLLLWAVLDRRLSGRTRLLLASAPLMYFLAWQGMAWWASLAEARFGAAERLAETDISSSRFDIWSNTVALIRMHPWTGVGFGEFNFAWTLTPFPDRPSAFFDHAHNLPLHLLAELGLPLGGAVIGLLLWALWRVGRDGWRRGAAPEVDVMRRVALAMLAMIGLHSLLEYPLWYAYFLLPTAWVWGLALALPPAGRDEELRSPNVSNRSWPPRGAVLSGAALVLGASLALMDFTRVTVIFNAAERHTPLTVRIAEGQRSLFFGHHADYAAATLSLGDPADPLAPFDRATHYLLDTRLTTAWAEALARQGQTEAARHLVARLAEFGHDSRLLRGCEAPASAVPPATGQPAPVLLPDWPCQPPPPPLPWRSFVR